MILKKDKETKESFFHLPAKDREYFALEEKEKKEKDTAVEQVFERLNHKKKRTK